MHRRHNGLRTAVLLGGLSALIIVIGSFFGRTGLIVALFVALGTNASVLAPRRRGPRLSGRPALQRAPPGYLPGARRRPHCRGGTARPRLTAQATTPAARTPDPARTDPSGSAKASTAQPTIPSAASGLFQPPRVQAEAFAIP
ncbi:hypothetical protein SNARM312S_00988 [Streptomyces narbonensis]